MSSCCVEHAKKGSFFATTKWGIISLSVSLVLSVLSFFWMKIVGEDSFFMYLNPGWIVIAVCGTPLFISAIKGVIDKKIKSSLLISIAIIASLSLEIIGWLGVDLGDQHGHVYVFAAAEIAFLMSLGSFIEDITVKKTRKGVERMMHLSPTTALVKYGNETILTPVSRIKIGSIVLIRPNDMISVDGTVVFGETAIDQSPITGESVPCDKTIGDAVYAGTWNKSGAIEVKVERAGVDTTVSKLVALVEEAEGKKAPIARVADKWASIIVPLAISLAIVVFFVTKLVGSITWIEAAIRGVTILVVFCPCALALATPTAIAAGIGTLSYRGIMVKSGKALEDLAKIQTIVFDKTGTLTTATIKVDDAYFENIKEKEFWMLVGSSEVNSEHPIAKAITNHAKVFGELISPETMKSLVGLGVECIINNKKVLIAKWEHLQVKEKNIKINDAVNDMLKAGKTVVGVEIDEKLVGAISVSDTVKPLSKYAVELLEKSGLETLMLTGDNESAAKSIAEKCGIAKFEHSLLPEQKLEKIIQLQNEGKKVCMIGDGVNDAPSLAISNCGVAMGALGSDVAIETAEVALLNDKIELVPSLVRVAKKVLSTIKRNIVIAMSINFAAVILSSFAILNPVTGALVHNCTSLLVVGSSALILFDKEKIKK